MTGRDEHAEALALRHIEAAQGCLDDARAALASREPAGEDAAWCPIHGPKHAAKFCPQTRLAARVPAEREALRWYDDHKTADGSYDGAMWGDLRALARGDEETCPSCGASRNDLAPPHKTIPHAIGCPASAAEGSGTDT